MLNLKIDNVMMYGISLYVYYYNLGSSRCSYLCMRADAAQKVFEAHLTEKDI